MKYKILSAQFEAEKIVICHCSLGTIIIKKTICAVWKCLMYYVCVCVYEVYI